MPGGLGTDREILFLLGFLLLLGLAMLGNQASPSGPASIRLSLPGTSQNLR